MRFLKANLFLQRAGCASTGRLVTQVSGRAATEGISRSWLSATPYSLFTQRAGRAKSVGSHRTSSGLSWQLLYPISRLSFISTDPLFYFTMVGAKC